MIQKLRAKIKAIPRDFWNDVFIVLVILLVALAAFGLGRLSIIYENRGGFELVYPGGGEEAAAVSAVAETAAETGDFVASISGSKYHYVWCPGARNIKESNKLYFSSKEDAEAAGYEPAANCKF